MPRFLAAFLALSLAIAPAAGWAPPAQAAAGDTILYSFPALTANPDNPNWTVTDSRPANMRLTPTSFQMINNSGSSQVNGEYLTIRFDIPESGLYDLSLQSWENAAGGVVDVQVDGELVYSGLSFYSPAQTAKTVKPLAAGVRLDKGPHTLTFLAKETVRLPSNGRYYLYLYLEDFRLTAAEIFPELNEVTLTAAETHLDEGAEAELTLTGKMAGGTPADLTAAEIVYTSSNPAIVEVESTGAGTAKVIARSAGRAYVTAAATLDGVTRESTLEFNVGVEPETIVYDFKQGAGLPESGWELGDRSVGTITSQPYGLLVPSNKIGDYVTFRISVPQDGYYEVRFNGAGDRGGAIAAASVDGMEVGTYGFYLASLSPSKGFAGMRTVYLTGGVHEFRLTVVDRYQLANNWLMMPNELRLVRKAGLPTIRSLELELSRTELMAGQTARVAPLGQLADGYAYDLLQASPASVTLSVYDPAIASLEADGRLRAHAPGTATVTADVYLDGIAMTASRDVLVNAKTLDSVTLTADDPQLSEGMTTQLRIAGWSEGEPVDLADAEIVYASLNPDIAAVDEDGVVTALSTGTAEIEAVVTLGPAVQRAVAAIEVLPPYLTELEVSMYRPDTFVGETRRLDIKGTLNNGQPADISAAEVVYASSNPAVVEVSESGDLKALSVGSAKITVSVTLGGVTQAGSVNVTVQELTSSKTRATYYTDEKVANARNNVQKYEWAKGLRDSAVAKAEKYLAQGPEFLWSMVPANTLPRSIYVNRDLGSPITGKEIDKYGNYPYLGDPVNEPWKIIDPSSGYKFPTNDFGAYYRSGLDEHGFFDPERADRSLLVNTLYPEKGPTWGVDDGFGWVDEHGNRYTFIAYYTHWFLWYGSGTSLLQNALNAMRDAYIYTGDPKYAKYGIILLDRIADVYPDLDLEKLDQTIFYNSHGGTNKGKAIGSIWETTLVKDFIAAYDAFFPALIDPEVSQDIVDTLAQITAPYDLPLKKSAVGIRRNIEDGILRQVYPGVKNAQIRGNNGFHQSALAMAAVVHDTMPETKEWLDFNFQAGGLVSGPWRVTGGNILATMVNDVDRDGAGNEAAPEYNRYWLSTYETVADVLDGYDKYPEADLYRNVKFRKMFSSIYPLMLSERYIPQIGDSGMTGNPGLLGLSKTQAIKAFEKFRDPVFAQLAHFMNNNRLDGIHGDIFSEDPDQIARDIAEVIETHGPLQLPSDNLTGYGFAVLRDGSSVKYDFGIPYLFQELPVTFNSKEYKIFDNITTLQFEATEVGDAIRFTFDVPRTDTYELSLKPYRTTTYGKYEIAVDGEPLTEFDFFGSVSEHEPIGTLQLTEGTHEITFTAIGQHPQSGGIKLGVSELALLDAAERERRDAAYRNTLRDVWMYYGRNGGHGHRDTLNIGMHAYGLDLLPDLGYPEFADATSGHRHEWVHNTISHNTVMVDKKKQGEQWVADPKLFGDGDVVKVIDVEAPKVYPDTVDLYKRTTAMIRVDEEHSYAVDFFRVKGGRDHHFSFHAAGESVTTEGLTLTPQPTGTYAGPDIEFEQRPADDSAPGWSYTGPGFHYLTNVERGTAEGGQFSVDWDIEDYWHVLPQEEDIHLRLTMLGDVDEVALADGIPPRNKPGNPPRLRYLIAHRQGTNLDSLFTSVIEPYRGERYIRSIEEAPVTLDGGEADGDVRAVKVELANGRTDYIVSSLNPDAAYVVDGKFTFRGQFGVYSEKDGRAAYGYVHAGTEIGPLGSPIVQSAQAELQGTVVDFTRELSVDNEIIVQMDAAGIDAEQLVGAMIRVENDGVRNAAYRIRGVEALGDDRYRLDIGDTTLIRSYADVNDFSKGFIYDIAEGAPFTIALANEVKLPIGLAAEAGRTELLRGETAQLHVSAVYLDGSTADLSDAQIRYESDNPAVAAVDGSGVITAGDAGTAVITATVVAGGAAFSADVQITVQVTAESLTRTLQDDIDSGDVRGPLEAQLTNSLRQAIHHMENGRVPQAIKQLDDFLKHLNNPAMQNHVSPAAKEALNNDAEALIRLWSESSDSGR
jgi:uncharacterized protein YjdB